MKPNAWRVTERMDGRHPKHPDYPLLPGDLLSWDGNKWCKFAPGLAIFGFRIDEGDPLEPVEVSGGPRVYVVAP